MEQSTTLELRNIHKSYGELKVLKGVDLSAKTGQIITIIGSSGSGKSTLLRCINQLEKIDSGEIYFNGNVIVNDEISNKSKIIKENINDLRKRVSMVFQQFNLWSHMTVIQNVTEAPTSVLKMRRSEALERARDVLTRVGLEDKLNEYPANLSGGQQQRAAIARALAMSPEIILFDEPTSALDPELEHEVVCVIKRLANENRTMILVTHDMKLAKDISNYILFMDEGKIVEKGSPDVIFNNTKTDRLKKFLETVSFSNT
ncbi:MAG: amino acid ABC transporter ATP-binding protein [Pseudomonadota bacterium]|nr:amino acid ABC transporter ATP-binding protein [Pseudomonadota bacterium]